MSKHGQVVGHEEPVADIWAEVGPRWDGDYPTTLVRLQYMGDDLYLCRKHPDGQWVTVRKATEQEEMWLTSKREPTDADRIKELEKQLAAANATVEKCKAAGFIDEQGNVVAATMQWLATDNQYETEQSPEEVAQFLYDNLVVKNGQVFAATPVAILTPQLFVLSVDADDNVSCNPANADQVAAFKQRCADDHRRHKAEIADVNANVQPVRAIPFPTAAEAARDKGGA